MVFGQLVVAHRRRLGLSQDELAGKAGLSVRTIRALESGRAGTPRQISVRLLADAFGLHGAQREAFFDAARDGARQPKAPQPNAAQSNASQPNAAQSNTPQSNTPQSNAAQSTGAQSAAVPLAAQAGTVPAQLPADVGAFTGRQVELDRLDLLVPATQLSDPPAATTPTPETGPEPALPVISVVSGTAGVGKTALAVRWAHQVRHRFPDGQLYVDLRGYDPERPLAAADALAGFLTALGVPGQQIPVDLDARAARFRTAVAGRRMLILLDNAATVDQVRPLLPGTASCAVVVTSRDSLAGLVARDGAGRLELDLLPPADAHALLARLIGGRVDAEPEAVATLISQCARLPLALRLVAELANSRPAIGLTDLAAELADEQRRVALLEAGDDLRSSVAAVFSWSLRQLPDTVAHLFVRLGLHPGPDVDAYAAAALIGTDLAQARRALHHLVRAHLITTTSAGAGRYGMHDLLRAYATGLAAGEPTSRAASDATAGGESGEALRRLFDFYLAVAAAAMDLLHPAEKHRRPTVATPGTPLPMLADADAARAWLDAERPALLAVIGYTAEHGWQDTTVALTTILYRYLSLGQYTESLTAYTHARNAARQIGDRNGEAQALLTLGIIRAGLGHLGPATDHHRRALALFQQTDDLLGQARARAGLGNLDVQVGAYRSAAAHYRKARTLYQQSGDAIGEARAVSNFGILQLRLGRYASASVQQQRALELFQHLGDRGGEAVALHSLGQIAEQFGRYAEAIEHLEQARAKYRAISHRIGEAWAEDALGSVQTKLGNLDRAEAHHRLALRVFRELNDHGGELWALHGLGDVATAAGRPAEAVQYHRTALAMTVDSGARDMYERIHISLGDAYRALSDRDSARTHYEYALRRYLEVGSGCADEVRDRLADLDHAAESG